MGGDWKKWIGAGAAILGAVFGGFIGASLAVSFGATAATATAGASLGYLAGQTIGATVGSMILGTLIGGSEPSSAANQAMTGALLNVRASVSPIPVVYGTRRVGGSVVFIEVGGDKKQYLHMVLAVASGPVESISDVWINDKPISEFVSNVGQLIRIKTHLGDPNQPADSDLVSEVPSWTVNHRLRGVAYVYVRCMWHENFFTGVPSITAVVSGRKVFNPATLVTEYSNNPALCIRDFLTNSLYGRGLLESSIDDQSIIDAAAYCAGAVSASHSYTLNGVVSGDVSVMTNLKLMLASCKGMLTFTGGKYRLVIDKEESSVFTFTEDNIIGSWNISFADKRNRFNKITATWVNPNKSWQPDLIIIENQGYLTADNGLTLDKEISLPFTTDFDMAHKLALQSLRQSRSQISVTFTATIEALTVEIGDIVTIIHSTPGWDETLAKKFRVVRLALSQTDEVSVTAVEYNSSVYNIDETGIETVTAATNLPNPLVVAEPSNLTFSELKFDTLGRGKLTWNVAPDAFVMEYEAQFKLQSSSVWLPAGTTSQNTLTISGLDVDAYDFRVRAINTIGSNSAWVTASGSISSPPILPRVSGLELFGLANGDEFGGKDAKFVWRKASSGYSYDIGSEPQGANSGAWDLYFKDYEVRILDTANKVLRVEHTVEPTYTYTFEKNAEDGGPRRNFTIEVFMRGRQNQLSRLPARLEVTNTPPSLPSGLAILAGIERVTVKFTSVVDLDYEGILVFSNTSSGYTPTTDDVVYDGPDTYIAVDFPANVSQYIRLAAYDAFGKTDLNYSSEYEVTPTSSIDSTPPAIPTGLTLSTTSSVTIDGTVLVKVIADWNDNTEDDFVMYGWAVKEGAGNFVFGAVDDSRAEWVVVAGTTIYVKVRAVDSSGNYSGYTSEESIVAGQDVDAPGLITNVTAIPSLRSIFLQWDNPSDNDFAYAAVYENTTDDSGSSVEIARISSDFFVRTGLNTGDTRFYWLKSVDASGNESEFHAVNGNSATTGAIVGGDIPDDTIVGNMIVAGEILTEHLLAGEIDANVLKAGTILTSGVNISGAFQTAVGQAATDVGSWSENPIGRANVKSTKLDPGLVLISGGTSLSDWRYGGDNTKIDGGNIGANTITANSLKIGNRNLIFSGMEFTANSPSANNVSWTVGSVTYADGSGGSTPINVSSGNAPYTTGTLYIYWVKDSTTLSSTTDKDVALGAENVLLASYLGGTNLVATYGRTTIEGDHIRANSIVASHLTTGELITNTAQIGDAVITNANIANLSAGKIASGTITADDIYLGANNRFSLDASTNRLTVNDGTYDRVKLGGLGGGQFGIEIYNASGDPVLTSGGVPASAVSGLGAFASLDQLTAANISTYMASAAIGSAYIDDLAVTSAKIENLAVDTIKIANAAVTNTVFVQAFDVVPVSITTPNAVLSASTVTGDGVVLVQVSVMSICDALYIEVRDNLYDPLYPIWSTKLNPDGPLTDGLDTVWVSTSAVRNGLVSFAFTYTPGPGSRTLILSVWTSSGSYNVRDRSIIITEIKK